jgi:hypothetical protein
MSRTKSLLRTLLIIGAASAAAVFGTFSAFSATTDNAGNQLSTGDVALSDNDSNGALYFKTNAEPGESFSQCIKVTFTGSMASDVRLYTSAVGALGDYVNLTITTGTTTGAGCTGFSADPGGPLYTGELDEFAADNSGWANGLPDLPEGASSWTNGSAVAYKFDVTIQDDPGAEGKDTNAHTFTWEAQNQ